MDECRHDRCSRCGYLDCSAAHQYCCSVGEAVKQDHLFYPLLSEEAVVCTRTVGTIQTSPLYRTNDPWTSKEAAQDLRGSPRLTSLQRLAYDLVKTYPGSTANELSAICGATNDTRKIPRRLSELRAAKLIKTEGWKTDRYTCKRGLRWWRTDNEV